MSATIYKDANFGGARKTLIAGFYSGDRDLEACQFMSNSCEPITRLINSIVIDANTIVVIYGSHGKTASSGARVLIGPQSISSLDAIGMGNKIASVWVFPYKAYESTFPTDRHVLVSMLPNLDGRRVELMRGDYTSTRFNNEFNLRMNNIQSIKVDDGTIIIMYNGSNFENSMDSIALVGPAYIGDLEAVGMRDKINAIRVLYNQVPVQLPPVTILPPPPENEDLREVSMITEKREPRVIVIPEYHNKTPQIEKFKEEKVTTASNEIYFYLFFILVVIIAVIVSSLSKLSGIIDQFNKITKINL